MTRTIAIASLLALSLGGCASMRDTLCGPREAVTDAGCAAWKIYGPATYSGAGDTPETVDSNRRINAAMDAACAPLLPSELALGASPR